MRNLVKRLTTRIAVHCLGKLIFLFHLTATICLAESPNLPEQFGIGREPSASEIEQWDIDIMPNGKQLPTGQGTVIEGEQAYLQNCLACHGPEGRDGDNDQLVDKFDPDNDFANDKTIKKTIGNYWPFATTLYDYINRAMPMTNPGTLTANEVYSLVAYLLYLNGIVDKNITLDAKTLPLIEMPANSLFYWSDEAKDLVGTKNKL
jgi:cytochrome c